MLNFALAASQQQASPSLSRRHALVWTSHSALGEAVVNAVLARQYAAVWVNFHENFQATSQANLHAWRGSAACQVQVFSELCDVFVFIDDAPLASSIFGARGQRLAAYQSSHSESTPDALRDLLLQLPPNAQVNLCFIALPLLAEPLRAWFSPALQHRLNKALIIHAAALATNAANFKPQTDNFFSRLAAWLVNTAAGLLRSVMVDSNQALQTPRSSASAWLASFDTVPNNVFLLSEAAAIELANSKKTHGVSHGK